MNSKLYLISSLTPTWKIYMLDQYGIFYCRRDFVKKLVLIDRVRSVSYLGRGYITEHVFVVKTKKKSFYFQAEWEEIALEWVATLEMMIDERKTKRKKKEMSIENFKIIEYVDAGGSGSVFLVKNELDQRVYAAKIIRKLFVSDEKCLMNVYGECRIMKILESDYTVKLHWCFEDTTACYLIMDYHPLGDLFTMITQSRIPPGEQEVREYLVGIVTAIEFIHRKDIIYRDLKLENLLITEEGKVILCDFGLSVQYSTNTFIRTCGTKGYLSPEMIKGQGYTEKIDWWCVGVI